MEDNFKDVLSTSIMLTSTALGSMVSQSHNSSFLQQIRSIIKKGQACEVDHHTENNGLGEATRLLASSKLHEISQRIYRVNLLRSGDREADTALPEEVPVASSHSDVPDGPAVCNLGTNVTGASISQYESQSGIDCDDWDWSSGGNDPGENPSASKIGFGLPSDEQHHPLAKVARTLPPTGLGQSETSNISPQLASQAGVDEQDPFSNFKAPQIDSVSNTILSNESSNSPSTCDDANNGEEHDSFLEDVHADLDFSWSEVNPRQFAVKRRCETSGRTGPTQVGKTSRSNEDAEADIENENADDENVYISAPEVDIGTVEPNGENDSFNISWDEH